MARGVRCAIIKPFETTIWLCEGRRQELNVDVWEILGNGLVVLINWLVIPA
jgi:hypothetical protein